MGSRCFKGLAFPSRIHLLPPGKLISEAQSWGLWTSEWGKDTRELLQAAARAPAAGVVRRGF